MRLRQAKQKKAEMDIIPMVDIVFQLIIFFLVATQVKKNDTAALTLPRAFRGETVVPQPEPPMILNILGPAAARGGKVYVISGNFLTLEELSGFLSMEQNRKRWKANTNVDPPVVRIRADQSAAFEDVQEALMTCQKHDIWQVRLVTLKRK